MHVNRLNSDVVTFYVPAIRLPNYGRPPVQNKKAYKMALNAYNILMLSAKRFFAVPHGDYGATAVLYIVIDL